MKSFKRIWMTLIIMILSVAMVIGTMSFTAFALDIGQASQYVTNVNIVSKVVYGGTFNVPAGANGATVKVTAPNGKVLATAAGSIKADQVGTYTVSYTTTVNEKDYSYDFQVYSYVEEEYSIKVQYNGADIPTYRQKNTEFTLPEASLVYYDEDGKEIKVPDVTVYTITSQDPTPVKADGTAKVNPTASGNLYITYYANIGGENGNKYYSKDFTVKVQDTFTDNTAPTLDVVNVPDKANINKKVTLPIATASDDFDENIKITVKVKLGDKEVVDVDVDENGFAVVKEGAEKIVFDNDKVMSFYPTETGKYIVTYLATDDSVPARTSSEHSYEIVCTDNSAPVFDKIDDYKIPANWGLSVKNESGVQDATIKFPIPEMIDNAGTDGMTVSFKMLDSENNTVISFNNILATDENSADFTYKGSADTYGVTDTVYKFSDPFDFNLVKTGSTTGDFTVEYRAKDKKGNQATKTYKIAVTSDYEDTDNPGDSSINDAPEYIVIAPDEDTFTVPTIEVSDKGDSRPHSEYTLSSAADSVNTLSLKGGEVLDIETIDNQSYLVLDDTNRVAIAGGQDITLSLTVTDNLGNSASDSKTIRVFSAESRNASLSLDTASLKFKKDAADETGTDAFKTKETINLGSFEIKLGANDDYRSFTGYELSVKNAAGDGYVETTSEYYYDTVNHKIVVRNIEFTAADVGVYQVNIRAFDLSGQNIVSVALVKVEKGSDDHTSTASAQIPVGKGSVNTKYTFRHTKTDNISGTGTYFEVHKVRGGKHSVMGTEMTAQLAGTYFINDGYAKYDAGAVGELTSVMSYGFSVADNESPVIEVQGVMPTYSKKSTTESKVTVTLPSMIAYSKNGNGTIEVTVQHAKGGSAEVTYNEADNTYSFSPTRDGEYKIYVVGSVGSAKQTAEYTMSCGDVVGPAFTVNNQFADRVTVGKEFEFGTIVAIQGENEDLEKYTYTKTLIDPSNEVVTDATISGTGTTTANKTKNNSDSKILLSKSGTYQVVYEVTDEVGNKTTFKQTITVVNKTGGVTAVSIAAISTVLIVVGVVLIAAVILYFVLFRKRKEKKSN